MNTTINSSLFGKTYKVDNKIILEDEQLKNLTFSIEGDLCDCGLSGKYLANVLIQDNATNKNIKKEYFCSLTKKEEDTNYIFLNHLESNEIIEMLKKDA